MASRPSRLRAAIRELLPIRLPAVPSSYRAGAGCPGRCPRMHLKAPIAIYPPQRMSWRRRFRGCTAGVSSVRTTAKLSSKHATGPRPAGVDADGVSTLTTPTTRFEATHDPAEPLRHQRNRRGTKRGLSRRRSGSGATPRTAEMHRGTARASRNCLSFCGSDCGTDASLRATLWTGDRPPRRRTCRRPVFSARPTTRRGLPYADAPAALSECPQMAGCRRSRTAASSRRNTGNQ